jgi:hypothetical protein
MSVSRSTCTTTDGQAGLRALIPRSDPLQEVCVPYATANISVAVRCCGDEVIPNREVSTASCDDLKWDENTLGSQHVCANSDIQGQCLTNLVSPRQTYAWARLDMLLPTSDTTLLKPDARVLELDSVLRQKQLLRRLEAL